MRALGALKTREASPHNWGGWGLPSAMLCFPEPLPCPQPPQGLQRGSAGLHPTVQARWEADIPLGPREATASQLRSQRPRKTKDLASMHESQAPSNCLPSFQTSSTRTQTPPWSKEKGTSSATQKDAHTSLAHAQTPAWYLWPWPLPPHASWAYSHNPLPKSWLWLCPFLYSKAVSENI